VGVDGLDVTDCAVRGRDIRLGIASPFAWARDAVVVFRGAVEGERYRVVINGADLGGLSGGALARGVSCRPRPE
jgi:hypothetical protein